MLRGTAVNLRLLLLMIAAIGVLLGMATGCTSGSSSTSSGGSLPIAKSGPESWVIDGKQYAVSSTYYLALPEGFQFTVEYEAPPGTNPGNLTDAEAYELALPLMRHAAENRLYDRKVVSKIGSGTATVSRIGVVLLAQTPAGTQGYRVARTLSEIEIRSGHQPRVQVSDATVEGRPAFSLTDVGVMQLLFLLGMILALGITAAAVVKWIRGRRHLSRKWLWLLAILVGVGKLGLNWTTRQVVFAPMSFQLFSVAALSEPGSTSWMLFLSLPLGALVFLLRKGSGDHASSPPTGSAER